jgi:hypothetical protein
MSYGSEKVIDRLNKEREAAELAKKAGNTPAPAVKAEVTKTAAEVKVEPVSAHVPSFGKTCG